MSCCCSNRWWRPTEAGSAHPAVRPTSSRSTGCRVPAPIPRRHPCRSHHPWAWIRGVRTPPRLPSPLLRRCRRTRSPPFRAPRPGNPRSRERGLSKVVRPVLRVRNYLSMVPGPPGAPRHEARAFVTPTGSWSHTRCRTSGIRSKLHSSRGVPRRWPPAGEPVAEHAHPARRRIRQRPDTRSLSASILPIAPRRQRRARPHR